MARPSVLMITPYLPYPPISGGRMRTYNLITYLQPEYEITLVAFGNPEEREFDTSPLSELCDFHLVERAPGPGLLRSGLLSLTSLKPLTCRFYQTPAMKETLANLLAERQFDLIHVESFYMLDNLPERLNVPVLLAEPAIEYIAWQRHMKVARPLIGRPGFALEALKMRLWEPAAWEAADVVAAMSEVDARIIRKAAPRAKVVLSPNAVDVHHFQPDPAISRDDHTAVYMGDYKYFPNTDAVLYFADEILPLIREKRPNFRLLLLGKNPGPELEALNDDPESRVTVAGLVDDTRPYLQSCAMFICPLRSGSGTRYKIMEALACGAPVISTTIGAEGLGAIDEEHLLIRDDPEPFAAGVIAILEERGLAERLSTRGREWVASTHAWEQAAATLSEAYQALLRGRI